MAKINDGLSTYHLSTGTHRYYQPAKGNFFELIVDNLDGLLKAGVETELATTDDYIQNGQEIIRLTVNKTSVPRFELNEIAVRKGNSVVYYAGTPTFNEGTLEVDDMIGAQSKAVLEAWQNLAYNVITDKGGRAYRVDDQNAGYKRDATLIEYTSDHVKVRSWKLIGCWIKNLDEQDYDKENDDLRRVSATFRYDRGIPDIE